MMLKEFETRQAPLPGGPRAGPAPGAPRVLPHCIVPRPYEVAMPSPPFYTRRNRCAEVRPPSSGSLSSSACPSPT